jgi:hypothetical protein
MLFAIYEQSNDRIALEEALKFYHQVREHWATLANRLLLFIKKMSAPEKQLNLRGHWLDRLPLWMKTFQR